MSHGRQVMHICGALEARNERSQQGCIFCAVGLSIPGTRGVEPTGAGPTGSRERPLNAGEEGKRGGGEVLSGAPPSQVIQSSPKLLPVVTTNLQSSHRLKHGLQRTASPRRWTGCPPAHRRGSSRWTGSCACRGAGGQSGRNYGMSPVVGGLWWWPRCVIENHLHLFM